MAITSIGFGGQGRTEGAGAVVPLQLRGEGRLERDGVYGDVWYAQDGGGNGG